VVGRARSFVLYVMLQHCHYRRYDHDIAIGALFGLWAGTILASFASSVGATAAFLVSRYVLRDAVQLRFGDSLSQSMKAWRKTVRSIFYTALYLFFHFS